MNSELQIPKRLIKEEERILEHVSYRFGALYRWMSQGDLAFGLSPWVLSRRVRQTIFGLRKTLGMRMS